MNAAMAGSRKRVKKNRSDGMSAKEFIADGWMDAKITMHNSFIALVFGLGIFFVSIVGIHAAMIAISIMVGQETGGTLDTVADLIIILTAVFMIGGLGLMLIAKADGWLFKKMRERIWRRDKITGEIIKRNSVGEEAEGDK